MPTIDMHYPVTSGSIQNDSYAYGVYNPEGIAPLPDIRVDVYKLGTATLIRSFLAVPNTINHSWQADIGDLTPGRRYDFKAVYTYAQGSPPSTAIDTASNVLIESEVNAGTPKIAIYVT